MKVRRAHVLSSLALLTVAAGLVYTLARGLTIDQSKPRTVLAGKPAPSLVLNWLQGEHLLRSSQDGGFVAAAQGKVLVLNFWASWCLSCRQEAGLLQDLWDRQRERVLVLGVAVHDEETEARRFARQYNKTYPLALDRNGRAAIDYGVTGVPETFIIDAQGVLQRRNIGTITADFLQQVNDFLPENNL